jgi:hypothetical protein
MLIIIFKVALASFILINTITVSAEWFVSKTDTDTVNTHSTADESKYSN